MTSWKGHQLIICNDCIRSEGGGEEVSELPAEKTKGWEPCDNDEEWEDRDDKDDELCEEEGGTGPCRYFGCDDWGGDGICFRTMGG